MDDKPTGSGSQASPPPVIPPARPDSGGDKGSPAMAEAQQAGTKPSSPRVKFAAPAPVKQMGRLPSPPPPPPPPTYNPRVSFDLFAHSSTVNPSFTLPFTRNGYNRQPTSRTYLCGTDESDYSAYALEYIIDKLVDDGDDIICVRVVDDKDMEMLEDIVAKREEYKAKAEKVQLRVKHMLDANQGPAVKVIIELVVGKIGTTFDRMVTIHHPDSVVVGTRGRSMRESNFGKSSVSEYLYQHSPVPVIIVRPAEKRRKNLHDRKQKPENKKYMHLSDKTAGESSEQALHSQVPEASEHERQAVAKAIGIPDNVDRLEAFMEQSRSRAASREPRPMSEDTPQDSAESTEDEDDGEGAPLSRQSSSASNLQAGWVTHEGESEPRCSFEDMPNYDPELADQVEVKKVTSSLSATALGLEDVVAQDPPDKGKGKES